MAQIVKCLSAVQETRVRSVGWEDPLEKEMAAHSSILAWKIPWMAEPGRLLSMGSQRVRHYWATSLFHFYQISISSDSCFSPSDAATCLPLSLQHTLSCMLASLDFSDLHPLSIPSLRRWTSVSNVTSCSLVAWQDTFLLLTWLRLHNINIHSWCCDKLSAPNVPPVSYTLHTDYMLTVYQALVNTKINNFLSASNLQQLRY